MERAGHRRAGATFALCAAGPVLVGLMPLPDLDLRVGVALLFAAMFLVGALVRGGWVAVIAGVEAAMLALAIAARGLDVLAILPIGLVMALISGIFLFLPGYLAGENARVVAAWVTAGRRRGSSAVGAVIEPALVRVALAAGLFLVAMYEAWALETMVLY